MAQRGPEPNRGLNPVLIQDWLLFKYMYLLHTIASLSPPPSLHPQFFQD